MTTFQVGIVAICIVVGTSLLVGADIDSGSLEGLEAFAAALAAAVTAGATSAAQLAPTVDAMLAFAEEQMGGKVSWGPRAGLVRSGGFRVWRGVLAVGLRGRLPVWGCPHALMRLA